VIGSPYFLRQELHSQRKYLRVTRLYVQDVDIRLWQASQNFNKHGWQYNIVRNGGICRAIVSSLANWSISLG